MESKRQTVYPNRAFELTDEPAAVDSDGDEDDFVIIRSQLEKNNYIDDLDMNADEVPREPVSIELSSAEALTENKRRERQRDKTKHRTKRSKEQNGKNTSDVTGGKETAEGKTHSASPSSQQKNIFKNVIYYNNRFIVLDQPDHGNNSSRSGRTKRGVDNPQMRMAEAGDVPEESVTPRSKSANYRKNMALDASSVTMQEGSGIEIYLTDPDNTSRNISERKKNKSIWRKIYNCLQDNRMKDKPGEIPLSDPNEYRVLKKVLNIIFITIGVTLFVAVVISVIYAFIVGDKDKPDTDTRQRSPST